MKTEKNILIAFVLNLVFSVLEFVGGMVTGSVSVLSDALHDLGDAAGIGVAWLLERKSRKQPDERHTYGYARYSALGGFLTTLILLLGSAAVIWRAVERILQPGQIRYEGMILIAVVGVLVNLVAALLTRGGERLNQRAVNLHMLEDVLGWLVVLVGAVVMKFTHWRRIDPLMSLGVAVFILFHAVGNLRQALDLFLEKTPRGIRISGIREQLLAIDGVIDAHHIHVRSLDGVRHCATAHIVIRGDFARIKEQVRARLREHGIAHVTLEPETEGEVCRFRECRWEAPESACCHHHHHSGK